MNREQYDRMLTDLARRLTDDGKLIEAGWVALRKAAVPPDVSEAQLNDMRTAFFAGAQHLFGCINSIMEEGEEPTEKDLYRMDQINAELIAFVADFARRNIPTKGRA